MTVNAMTFKVSPPSPESLRLLGNLSNRQMHVARMVAQGMTHKDVAAVLGISTASIRNHISAIKAKTNARNTNHIMRLVIWNEALLFLEK